MIAAEPIQDVCGGAELRNALNVGAGMPQNTSSNELKVGAGMPQNTSPNSSSYYNKSQHERRLVLVAVEPKSSSSVLVAAIDVAGVKR